MIQIQQLKQVGKEKVQNSIQRHFKFFILLVPLLIILLILVILNRVHVQETRSFLYKEIRDGAEIDQMSCLQIPCTDMSMIQNYTNPVTYIYREANLQNDVLEEEQNQVQFFLKDKLQKFKEVILKTKYKEGRGIVITIHGIWNLHDRVWSNIQIIRRNFTELPHYLYEEYIENHKFYDKGAGCKLPIELWAYDGELSEQQISRLTSLPNVSFHVFPTFDNIESIKRLDDHLVSVDRNTAIQSIKIPPKIKGDRSYITKIGAILNSRFQQVIYMDSDVLPIYDPSLMLDTREFQKYGAFLWPDSSKISPENPIFKVIDSQCLDELEVESGVLMFDKDRDNVIQGLLGVYYMNLNYKIYDNLLYKDKDTFKFGFKMTKQIYYLIPHYPGGVGFYEDDKVHVCTHTTVFFSPAGYPFFLHMTFPKHLNQDELAELENNFFNQLVQYQAQPGQGPITTSQGNFIQSRTKQKSNVLCNVYFNITDRQLEYLDFKKLYPGLQEIYLNM